MRKKVAAGAALVAVAIGAAVLAGPPLADRISSAPCDPPRFLMSSDWQRLSEDVDTYLQAAMLSDKQPYKTKRLDKFDWSAADQQEATPRRVRASVILGVDWAPMFGPLEGATYHLEARRDCAGGAWRIVKLVEDRGGVGEAPAPVPG